MRFEPGRLFVGLWLLSLPIIGFIKLRHTDMLHTSLLSGLLAAPSGFLFATSWLIAEDEVEE